MSSSVQTFSFLIQNLHLHPIKYMLLDFMSKSNSALLQRQSQQETVDLSGDNMESRFLSSQDINPLGTDTCGGRNHSS